MERYFVEYLNKSKKFAKDKKYFDSYDEAEEWAKNNFEKYHPDMIFTEIIEEQKKPENKKKVIQDFSTDTSLEYKELCKKLKSFVVKRASNPKMENVHVEKGYLYAWNLDDIETMLIIKNIYNLKPGIYAIGNGELIYSEPLDTEFIEVFSKSFAGKTIFDSVEVSDKNLKEAIKLSSLSLGKDSLRPVMSSAIIDLQKGIFNVVSTNAHVLYKGKFELDKDVIGTLYLGGAKTLPIYDLMTDYLTLSLYGEKSDSFDSVSSIKFSNIEILVKHPGKYPNYDAVIPGEATKKIVINEELLQKADDLIKRDKVVRKLTPTDINNGTEIQFSDKKAYLKLFEQDELIELGNIEYTEEFNTINFDSSFLIMPRFNEEKVISLGYNYFKKITQGLPKIEMYFKDNNKAAIVNHPLKGLVKPKRKTAKKVTQEQPKKVTQEQPKKVTQEQPKKVTQEQPKKVTQEQPKIKAVGETKTREKRTATKDLLMSKNEFEVYLGVVYKLAKKVRETEKTKADKFRITRQMNIIKTGYMQDTNENKIKIARMLAPLVQDIINNDKVQADKRMIDTYTKIYDIYKSFGAKKRTSKDEKEKENVLATFNKLK